MTMNEPAINEAAERLREWAQRDYGSMPSDVLTVLDALADERRAGATPIDARTDVLDAAPSLSAEAIPAGGN